MKYLLLLALVPFLSLQSDTEYNANVKRELDHKSSTVVIHKVDIEFKSDKKSFSFYYHIIPKALHDNLFELSAYTDSSQKEKLSLMKATAIPGHLQQRLNHH